MHKVNIFTGEKINEFANKQSLAIMDAEKLRIFLVGIKSDGLKVKRHMSKMRIPRKLLVL